ATPSFLHSAQREKKRSVKRDPERALYTDRKDEQETRAALEGNSRPQLRRKLQDRREIEARKDHPQRGEHEQYARDGDVDLRRGECAKKPRVGSRIAAREKSAASFFTAANNVSRDDVAIGIAQPKELHPHPRVELLGRSRLQHALVDDPRSTAGVDADEVPAIHRSRAQRVNERPVRERPCLELREAGEERRRDRVGD